jgi:hypothetical protein
MRTIRVELDEGTVERLSTERELLGFQDLESYLQWIVDNRTDIAAEGERDELLSAYADRVEELERQVEETDPDPEGFDGELTPERVKRITDDDLAEAVDELNGVGTARIDEMARQAVARTRKRLGREVGTGLQYRSTGAMTDDVRPGEDVADLDKIAVPGYDDDIVERRREAVGAALAYLKDEREATRSEVVDTLYGEYPAGYDSETGWWGCIKQGFRQVSAVKGGTGRRTWTYEPAPGITDARGVTVTRLSNSE